MRPPGVSWLDFLITLIEIGDELESSVSILDRVAVSVDDCSVSLFFNIMSSLGGEPGLFLKDGVFLSVNDRSLRDLDVAVLLL